MSGWVSRPALSNDERRYCDEWEGCMMRTEGERAFGFLLYDAARFLRRDFEKRAKSVGLTRAQWSVIAHLLRGEGITQKALADILDLKAITLTRMVERLEKDGWIVRRAHATDRRAKLLFLTSKVRPVVETMSDLGAKTRARALRGFSKTEQLALLNFLTRIKSNLADEVAEPASGRNRASTSHGRRGSKPETRRSS